MAETYPSGPENDTPAYEAGRGRGEGFTRKERDLMDVRGFPKNIRDEVREELGLRTSEDEAHR